MGFSRKRIGKDGRPRYTACHLDMAGRERSAGTFGSRREADKAWQMVEAMYAAGRPSDPRSGRMTFRTYVDSIWFPNHVLEPSTRQSYRYNLDRHILPMFGPMRMSTILPMHVRQWVSSLGSAGVSPATIRHNKIVLSAIFTTALNDLVVGLHPCRGVKSPTVPLKEMRILTPQEYDVLQTVLPQAAQLLIETAIESGLRWGELTELRLRDVHPASAILTVSRGVVELQPRFHPTGGRFFVKPYPKGRRSRRFKLGSQLVSALVSHAEAHRLAPDDLLFSFDHLTSDPPAPRPLASVDSLGLTEPNVRGRRYQHGTLSAYTAGRCRCVHCRGAFAAYRAERRVTGLDSPRGTRARDTDGHIPRDWFRRKVWAPACGAAGIDPPVRLHDLRHSNASARRWRRLAGRQGATRPPQHRNDREVPAHVAGRGRDCANRSRPGAVPYEASGGLMFDEHPRLIPCACLRQLLAAGHHLGRAGTTSRHLPGRLGPSSVIARSLPLLCP